MTSLKSVLLVTVLLASGSSLVLAQTPPTAGPNPPANVTGGPNGTPVYTSGPNLGTPKASHRGTRHHRMYMSAKSTHHHKGSKLTPSNNANPQMKQ